MTKEAAIYSFWASFGLEAYEENAVPTDDPPDFPYITYELVTDDLGNDTAMTASVWYRSASWTEANARAEEIGRRLGYSGVMLSCDGGRIWMRRDVPFAQSMGDESDDRIRRKIIRVTASFLTNI